MPDVAEAYLGDGVYASYDGMYLWLDLRAQPGNDGHVCRIALEPSVYVALEAFVDRIWPKKEADHA